MRAYTEPMIIRLFYREKGHCFWCREPMSLQRQDHPNPQPGDMATIDHLYERFDPRRWAPRLPGEIDQDRLVCACSRCNNRRQAANWAKLSENQRDTYAKLPRDFWPDFFKAQIKVGVLPSIPENEDDVISFLLSLSKDDRTRHMRTVMGMKHNTYRAKNKYYPPLPPVSPEEQDHLRQAAE